MLIIQIRYLDWNPIIIQCISNSLRAKHSTSYEKYAILFSFTAVKFWYEVWKTLELPDKNMKFRNTVVVLLYRITNFLLSCQYSQLHVKWARIDFVHLVWLKQKVFKLPLACLMNNLNYKDDRNLNMFKANCMQYNWVLYIWIIHIVKQIYYAVL